MLNFDHSFDHSKYVQQRNVRKKKMKDKYREQSLSDNSSLSHQLSEGQKALWFLSQIDPSSRSYNIYCSVKIGTALDTTLWHQAWKELFNRHSILRTTYTSIQGNPVGQIYSHGMKNK